MFGVTWLGPNSVNTPGVEASPVASAALPLAAVPGVLVGLHVEVVDVIHQVLQRVEQQVALEDRRPRSDAGLSSAG